MNSPRETSMYCCCPALAKLKFMENLGTRGCIPWALFSLSTLRTWAFSSVGEVEQVALRLPKFAIGKGRIFSCFDPTTLWLLISLIAERYLSPSEGAKRALDLREKCPLKNCGRRLPEQVWKKDTATREITAHATVV